MKSFRPSVTTAASNVFIVIILIQTRAKPQRFVTTEKTMMKIPACIHAMMGLTKSIGEIVKMQPKKMIIIMMTVLSQLGYMRDSIKTIGVHACCHRAYTAVPTRLRYCPNAPATVTMASTVTKAVTSTVTTASQHYKTSQWRRMLVWQKRLI